jgi:hypothetical protein
MTEPTPEYKLWAAVLNIRTCDAIMPFHIPNYSKDPRVRVQSLNEQYEKFASLPADKLRTLQSKIKRDRNLRKAMWFFETNQLDEVAADLGYGGEFCRRAFAFVQEAHILRNKILAITPVKEEQK